MEMLKWGAEGTTNELMPRAASRRRCDQLVARLGTLQTSIPNAGEPMAKAPFNHSPSAPAIEPPIDRRCARAAEHPPRRLSPGFERPVATLQQHASGVDTGPLDEFVRR